MTKELSARPKPGTATREMIGESAGIGRVLRQVGIVAPVDSPVLIHGETGTGKELVAHAIHNRSPRAAGPFVKVNCGAIPTGLLESELFGSERGAYTGAVTQRKGRFELANHGTLFLDEIGDLPMELQPKLLRALQEQEFERLGGSQTISVDVRIVTATHRNLRQMVADGTFRTDLYYRLEVFPIELPPLRERGDDIRILAEHYVGEFAERFKKQIDSIPENVMNELCRHEWPGNIRELQNFVERAVLLTEGRELQVPVTEQRLSSRTRFQLANATLAEMERLYITEVLDQTNWVLGGPSGAAARLGLPRTSLISRMAKHGITRKNRRPQLIELVSSQSAA